MRTWAERLRLSFLRTGVLALGALCVVHAHANAFYNLNAFWQTGQHGGWSPSTTTGAPTVRTLAASVWTGSKMIVWGGGSGTTFYNDGFSYDPVANSWATITTSPLAGRSLHTASWTGAKMLVWGGVLNTGGTATNTGAVYDVAGNSWTSMTTTSAPAARYGHTGVWTGVGSRLAIWGGYNGSTVINTGGFYNVAANTWGNITTASAPPARWKHIGVFTGKYLLIWGGYGASMYNNGGLCDITATTPSWTVITSSLTTLTPRQGAAGVWTGRYLAIWGGATDTGATAFANDGALYDPKSNTFPVIMSASPLAGAAFSAAQWTGSQMVIWGGQNGTSTTTSAGATYDPFQDLWELTQVTGSGQSLTETTSVWTGAKMLVFGGRLTPSDTTGTNVVQSFDPDHAIPDQWAGMAMTGTPTATYGFYYPPSVGWTGSKLIMWGGCACSTATCSTSAPGQNKGSVYDPVTNAWTVMTTTSAAAGRSYGAMVWTGSQMIVWGGVSNNNSSGVDTLVSTGGRYDPNTNTWAAIASSGLSVRRSYFTAWTGTKMVIWGGYNSATSAFYNDGGLYDPAGNTWVDVATVSSPPVMLDYMFLKNNNNNYWSGKYMLVANPEYATYYRLDPVANAWATVTTVGAPAARTYSTTVFTGSKFLIWGGNSAGNNSGYLYDPNANTWSTITTSGAPTNYQYAHNAVWTGRQMLVWGGYSPSGSTNSGAIYDAMTNRWTSMTTSGAPAATSSLVNPQLVWTGSQMLAISTVGAGPYTIGKIYGLSLPPAYTDTWTTITTSGAPAPRHSASNVWTGSKMIIWGGANATPAFFNNGGLFDPVTNSWSSLTTTGAPAGREAAGTVWTGSQMLVWGGCGVNSGCVAMNNGGMYDPILNSWSTMTTTNAPAARYSPQTAWTGKYMIAWSGSGSIDTGGLFDPVANAWTTMTTTSGRAHSNGVWTGSKMMVFGGELPAEVNTIAIYDPVANQWTESTSAGAPSPRSRAHVVWTGSQLIVWGGVYNTTYYNDGAIYDYATNTWSPMATANAPGARSTRYSATGTFGDPVWTGSKMVVWGGLKASTVQNTGAVYDPVENSWKTMTSSGAPAARSAHAMVWTGTSLIVWGGWTVNNTGGIWTPSPRPANVYIPNDAWVSMPSTNTPAARYHSPPVWTGSKFIVWGGYNGSSGVNTGAVFDPIANSWSPTTTSGAPGVAYAHVAMWTGAKLAVWGGSTATNQGGLYDPDSNSWSLMTTSGAPTARLYPVGAWTGRQLLVWGGTTNMASGAAAVNTGGAYDPLTNSWTTITTTSAPSARMAPSSTWTGKYLIVWGGSTAHPGTGLNDGSLYDPITNAWTTMTTTGRPTIRYWPTNVWTGRYMVLWGGTTNGSAGVATGGRYDPYANTWTTMSTSTLAARMLVGHAWSGEVVMYFGGLSSGTVYADGALYDPIQDTWTNVGASPTARYSPAMAWTGSSFIVWGGIDGTTTPVDDGNVYTP